MFDEGCFPSVQAVTRGPKHHFFGYYDKSPWDSTGRYMLALEVEFMDRAPTPNDAATIGLIDLKENCLFRPVAKTYAWNWQQGCMLQWMPNTFRRRIIYNDRRDGRFISVIYDVESGEVRSLPLPIYALTHDGRYALTLNFSRLDRTRPGYGYAGVHDPTVEEKAPENDGIYLMDLRTGEYDLIISLAQIVAFRPRLDMRGAVHWFNHLLISPNDQRFIFLHRWSSPTIGKKWLTRLFTANLDGSDIYLVADDGMVSHFDWRDSTHILAWARKKEVGDHYYLFTDCSEEFQIIGKDVLNRDGHCSYSPDRRWILTDTYPDQENKRRLLLYHPETKRLIELGRFYSPPKLRGAIRCDLHPRWSRDGHYICFDSAHEDQRQMYIIDVSEVI